MAEAHQANAVRFTVGDDGIQLSIDKDLIIAYVWGLYYSFKHSLWRLRNRLRNGIYPATPITLIIWTSVISSIYYARIDPSFGLIDWFSQRALVRNISSLITVIDVRPAFGCLTFSSLVWIVGGYISQYLLRAILSTKFWLYESPDRISYRSVILCTVVKFLCLSRPQMLSYQKCLPALPVPNLKDTVKRYMKTVEPLLPSLEFSRLELMAKEFQSGIGPKLQYYLTLRSWLTNNYVTDWWEDYVYLRGRQPIMINSNYYMMDVIHLPTASQAARAANVAYAMLKFRRLIEMETLEPVLAKGFIPLCNFQYQRLFNTTRIPGESTDKLLHRMSSRHVAVYHKGRYFKVPVFYSGTMLKPAELEQLFEAVLEDKSEPAAGEQKLAALTAGKRADWALARQVYFSSGINKRSLDIIENAAFFITLDEDAHDYDAENPEAMINYAHSLISGNCYNRWFDKSLTLVVYRNGRLGLNCEHTHADAPIAAHLLEWFLAEDSLQLGYTNGRARGATRFTNLRPLRLTWNLNEDCQTTIANSLADAQLLAADLELNCFLFDDFGKRLSKKLKMSPDGFLQMVLQLAYYRDHLTIKWWLTASGLTYEASMTRLFWHGRTETVRSCTKASHKWVLAMEDEGTSVERRQQLLRDAVEYHRLLYCDAMAGHGVDRHLFCLYVVARYKHWVSAFLEEVVSQPWKLSTSQTPSSQTGRIDLKRNPELGTLGGGFGPVADDGYGVSYIIVGEDRISFHLSAKKSCEKTDTRRFGRHIVQAMRDVRDLFNPPPATDGGDAAATSSSD